MRQTECPSSDDAMVRRLASSLERIADRLGDAQCADDFVAALEENTHLWEQVRRVAHRYGWTVPRSTLDFSLASSERGRISDQDVEALIAINRQVSSSIRTGRGPVGPVS